LAVEPRAGHVDHPVIPDLAEGFSAGRPRQRQRNRRSEVVYRYSVRYAEAMATCERCGERLAIAGRGRTPRYCSTRCRVAAHRARHRLPRELTERARWVRHEDKRPITPDGRPASSTDPRTWSAYREAARSKVGDGLGFVLGDGVACLDIDHCLDGQGRPDARARAILARVPGAYVEVSPSGRGLHVWGAAPEQPGRRHEDYEAYAVGRYITVTGNVYQPGRLVDLSEFF